MSAISLAEVEAGLKALSGIDFGQALTAFRTRNLAGELTTVEDVLAGIAVFVPDAQYVSDALQVLGFVASGYQTGLIRPAQPEDPAMERVTGSHAR